MKKFTPGRFQQSPRWAFMKWFEIPDRENPDIVYLRRLRIFQCPWFAVYLHWIFLPDNDRDPHDHPWNFWSWIVKGGYAEEVWPKEYIGSTLGFLQRWGRWTVHRMVTSSAHKIYNLTRVPTITFIITGRRQRDWGFWTPTGFVPYYEYDKGAGPDPFMS